MPLAIERAGPRKPFSRRAANLFEIWNRKLHFYIGLFLLFFLWLFAFTGLLLNHQSWSFAEFWTNRKQSDVTRPIQAPPAGGDLVQARDIMRQLGIAGEIEWSATSVDPQRFNFQVSRPGHSYQVATDLVHNVASLHTNDLNVWGVMHVLHTFTGVRLADSRNQRDWILTSIWAYCMDAVAAGIILMVLSSYYMWYRLIRKRRLGIVVLALGWTCCGWFALGLRWMTSWKQ